MKFVREEEPRNEGELLMPFGRYEDTPVGDVPASYLCWFLEQHWAKKYQTIFHYCKKNEAALKQEAEVERHEYKKKRGWV